MTILSFAFTLFAAFILVLGALLGFFRGWKKSVVDIGVAVISLILSAIIAAPILSAFEGSIDPFIRDIVIQNLGEESYTQLMEASPTVDMLISKLPVALLAPVAFMLIFSLIAFVASFFVPLIASAIFGSDKKKKSKKEGEEASEQEEGEKKPMSRMNRHLLGIPGGIVCAAIVTFAILLPFAGYIGAVNDALDELKASESQDAQNAIESDTFNSINEILEPLGDDVALNITYTMGGKALFNAITSVNINDERYPVSRALSTAINIIVDAEPLTNASFENYGETQVTALNNIREDVDGEPLVTSLVAEIVSGAARSWEKGETFLTIKKPEVEGNFGSIIDKLLSIYATMTYDTVSSDLRVITDLFSVLIENDAMSVLKDNDKLMDLLGKEGFVSALVRPIQGNTRMQPIVKEISNLAIALMAEQIGIPQNNTEIYNDLLEDVASSLNDAKKSEDPDKAMAELKESVVKAFEDREVEIPTEIMDYVTEYMLKAFESKDNITVEDVIAYFTEISDEFEQYGVSAVSYSAGIVSYSASIVPCGLVSYDFVSYSATPDLSSIVKDLMFELQTLNIPEEKLELLKTLSNGVKNGEVESGLVTVEMIMEKIGNITSEDAEQESQVLESIMISASNVLKSIEGTNGTDMIKSLDADALQGIVLGMKNSKIFGDVAEPLLEAMFTSKTLKDTGFIDKSTFEDVKESGFDNISNTIQTVQKTVEIVESLTSSTDQPEGSEEDSTAVEENIEWLIVNMSPSTSKLLSKQLTDEKLKEFGVPKKNVKPVSEVLSNVLDSMASESELSKEEYKKEADAIKHLYDLVTKIGDADEDEELFNGTIGDADDIVSTILGSKVISKAMVKTAYDGDRLKDDPFETGAKLAAKNVSVFIDAINDYTAKTYANADKDFENQKIRALAACFNMPVEISSNGTVTAK